MHCFALYLCRYQKHKTMTKIQKLQETLKKVTGTAIELTVISEKEFSFYWEGSDESIFDKLKNYFANTVLEVYALDGELYDTELNACCAFAKM